MTSSEGEGARREGRPTGVAVFVGKLGRFLTALGVAAMVGLRNATGLAPPPPKLFTEQVEWLSPEPEGDGEPEVVFGDPERFVPQGAPNGPARADAGNVGMPKEATVGGWLLVFTLLLVPSGISSAAALFLPRLREAAGIHGFGLAVLVLTAIGNLGGVFLVLRRNRVAPAFFTLYPPILLALNLLLPDLLAQLNARLAALGGSPDLGIGGLAVLIAVNAALVVWMVIYWSRSERVAAVFGTRGLGLLRKALG